MYGAPISRTASPTPSMGYMSPSINDFQIEKVARTPAPKKSFPLPPETVSAPGYGRDEFTVYRDSVNRLLDIKARQFAVSGRVPCDSSQLVLFFRSKVSLITIYKVFFSSTYNGTERNNTFSGFPGQRSGGHTSRTRRPHRRLQTTPNLRLGRLRRSRVLVLPTQPPSHNLPRNRQPSHPRRHPQQPLPRSARRVLSLRPPR